jgi:hypothetical protein
MGMEDLATLSLLRGAGIHSLIPSDRTVSEADYDTTTV